jgi:hypothetical protein
MWDIIKEALNVTVVNVIVSRFDVPQNYLHHSFDAQVGPVAAGPFMKYVIFAFGAKYVDNGLLYNSILNVGYAYRTTSKSQNMIKHQLIPMRVQHSS